MKIFNKGRKPLLLEFWRKESLGYKEPNGLLLDGSKIFIFVLVMYPIYNYQHIKYIIDVYISYYSYVSNISVLELGFKKVY